ncbi:hypothetical protein HanRHA438_Chr10g0475901 [Helianthus annuus]|nr:hypothetical protein HanRHA438_Chr10g0475901 [Helianthus annuus]
MAYTSTKEYLNIVDRLTDDYNIPKNITDSLLGYVKSIYRSELEDRFSSPMLWIGMYIASASLVCILAMLADLVYGLRSKKLWFPSKYFRIDSAFLTVISIAMKLPVDLTGSMPGYVLVHLCLYFVCIRSVCKRCPCQSCKLTKSTVLLV